LDAERSELCALYLILKSDVDQCKEKLSDEYTGVWDRVYTKAIFSMVEGISFRIRQYIVSAVDAGIYSLDATSVNFLSESTYKIDSSGKIKEKDEYLVFFPGFKFTFKSFGKCLGMESFVETAFGDIGFNNFKKSVEIRNRLTHPKRTQEMRVSGTELSLIQNSEEWFHALVMPLIKKAFEIEEQYNENQAGA
jgi:hypothetical protein